MDWKTIGDIAFYVCTAVTIAFAVIYFLLAPWWKTLAGRNIMAVMGAMALAFGYFSWAIAAGGIPNGFHPMRAILFTCIAASVAWRTVIFIKHHLIRSLKGESNELEDVR